MLLNLEKVGKDCEDILLFLLLPNKLPRPGSSAVRLHRGFCRYVSKFIFIINSPIFFFLKRLRLHELLSAVQHRTPEKPDLISTMWLWTLHQKYRLGLRFQISCWIESSCFHFSTKCGTKGGSTDVEDSWNMKMKACGNFILILYLQIYILHQCGAIGLKFAPK